MKPTLFSISFLLAACGSPATTPTLPPDADANVGPATDGATPDAPPPLLDAAVTACSLPPGTTTWALRPAPTSSHSIADLTFAPDGTLFAAVFREGIYRARGPCYDTWEHVYAREAPWLRIAVSTTGVVIATSGIADLAATPPLPLAIVRSLDGGDTWTDILPDLMAGPAPDPVSFPSITTSPDSPWIYLGSGWRSGESILWRSMDGVAWSTVTPTAARAALPRTVSVGIVAEPGGVVFMGTEGQGTWGSADYGVTWPGSYREGTPATQGREMRHATCGAYVGSFDPGGGGGGGQGGLYTSDGTAPFAELPAPPGIRVGSWSARVVGFACTPTGQIVMVANQEFVGGARVVAILDRVGGTWRDARDGIDPTHLMQTLERGADGVFWAAGTNGGLYRTRVPVD